MLKRPVRRASHGPLRVALLCSRRAPGLDYLLDDDPNRGRLYDLVIAVTSDPACDALAALDAAQIPAAIHDIRAWHRTRGARLTDLRVRRGYDARTAGILERFHPDLVLLASYLHVLTPPMLDAFPGRIVNVHDSDLTLTDASGRPRYRGLRSTRDAIAAGEPETRSTAHLVTPEVDVGPLLARSWPFPVDRLIQEARGWPAPGLLKGYAAGQRRWMMRSAWGPLLARAIERFAQGQVDVRDGRAYLGGMAGPELLAAPVTAPHPALVPAGEH